jgi:hypothetical protein
MRGFDNAGRSFSNNPGAVRFPGSEVKRMSQISERLLFWLPRILSIAFVAFIAMFALDVFSESHGFLEDPARASKLDFHHFPAAVCSRRPVPGQLDIKQASASHALKAPPSAAPSNRRGVRH